ncbi:ABC transporter substrate-binding protein [Calothrix sp. NIES-3974]|uniref:ABC transporter substrate-binding protein n=1 Tax=Calothrix sp. NIES-3974 TaxID=2005462 RepID=UPI000B5ED853|nr:ABC transporter substrate-binding protein [Calothrix sp. NIES-3974]BAZ07494.1 putative iron ABC transporter substrate binding protein [Calothrix sp. NIES-3974]
MNIAGVAILKSARNPNIAQKFVEFMLGKEAQEYFASETFEYPLISGVEPQGQLKSLKEVKQKTQNIDLSNLKDLEATLKLMQSARIL